LAYIVRKWTVMILHDPQTTLDETIKGLGIAFIKTVPRDSGF